MTKCPELYRHYVTCEQNYWQTRVMFRECSLNRTKFTVFCSPLYIGTGVKGELACSHSTRKSNTQSTSDKYADWYRYPQWCMTFSKLYGTLGPGRAREGEWRERRTKRQGKGWVRGQGGWTKGKHFEIWPRLEQQCPLFIQSDRDTLAKQISLSWDSA